MSGFPNLTDGSNSFRNFRHGTMTLYDAAGTPNTVTVVGEEGGLRWNSDFNISPVYDRGGITGFSQGKDQPGGLSFTIRPTQFIQHVADNTNPIGVFEFMNNYWPLASPAQTSPLTSTDPTGQDGCSPVFTFNFRIDISDPCGGTLTGERLVWEHCALASQSFEENEEANTISFELLSATVVPTITRI